MEIAESLELSCFITNIRLKNHSESMNTFGVIFFSFSCPLKLIHPFGEGIYPTFKKFLSTFVFQVVILVK
ncbi:hypothetical protein SDC9_210389 [bioreactor metagenome]|uniref:Uncharacterized protein n=1 Tax=bioreactor metagenome TaxID=1076179 RepID=A0A645JH17_9ZZZZ